MVPPWVWLAVVGSWGHLHYNPVGVQLSTDTHSWSRSTAALGQRLLVKWLGAHQKDTSGVYDRNRWWTFCHNSIGDIASPQKRWRVLLHWCAHTCVLPVSEFGKHEWGFQFHLLSSVPVLFPVPLARHHMLGSTPCVRHSGPILLETWRVLW